MGHREGPLLWCPGTLSGGGAAAEWTRGCMRPCSYLWTSSSVVVAAAARLNMRRRTPRARPRGTESIFCPRDQVTCRRSSRHHFRPGIVPLLPWRVRRPGQIWTASSAAERRPGIGDAPAGSDGAEADPGWWCSWRCPTNEEGGAAGRPRRALAPRSLPIIPRSENVKTSPRKVLQFPQYTKVPEGEAFLRSLYTDKSLRRILTPSPEFTVL